MKILFLVPYPLGESPSQRFRFEQYFEILRLKGHVWKVQSFLSPAGWRRLYDSTKTFRKALDVIEGILKRIASLFSALDYDIIFIHREVSPIGPPLFEWILAKVLSKKIIYDFDDAIWLTDRPHESFFLKIIKWRSKVQSICQWSYKVSCGNEYLCDYARRFNKTVMLNPSTLDTEKSHNPSLYQLPKVNASADFITIAWTGSHSTLKYLEELEHVLQQIEKKHSNVEFLVIADRPPKLSLKRLVFILWTKENEVKALSIADIGLMPLPDNEWTRGKCGFKALQYMSLEISTLASPVGVNANIIMDKENGFLCKNELEWLDKLEHLILEPSLRRIVGKNGRKTVEDFYSIRSNSVNFLSLFN